MYTARQIINDSLCKSKQDVFQLESKVKSLNAALKVLSKLDNKDANNALKEEIGILKLEIRDLMSLCDYLQEFET